MDTPKIINSLEWCFGYGGLHLGLKRVLPSLRIIAASEIEAYAVANLVAKIESGRLDAFPIWTNLKTFPCEEFYGLVDIFGAGYPCQPFSSAGRRNGADDPRHLWPFVRRAVEIIRPRYCFFENVEGHISLGLREVLTELALLGYRVENSRGEPTWGVFSAAECGAPHNRKRVFILAERNDQPMGDYLREQIERVNARGFFDFIAGTSQGDGQAIADRGGCVHRQSEIVTTKRGFDAQRDAASNRSEDLENTTSERCRGLHEQHSGRSPEHADSTGESLADSASVRTGKLRSGKEAQQSRLENNCIVGVGQADSNEQGLQGDKQREFHQQGRREIPHRSTSELRPLHWPAFVTRPGQGQHEWEPPRLITVKRGLGGGSNGRASNVDRLRLLGNGIYPAAAAKAFVTLYSRLL